MGNISKGYETVTIILYLKYNSDKGFKKIHNTDILLKNYHFNYPLANLTCFF
jgi:hypothetical protein